MTLDSTTTTAAPIGANTAAPTAFSEDLVQQLLLEDAARELAEQIDAISTRSKWNAWRRKHHRVLAAVYRLVPECPARRALSSAGRAAKRCFERYETREVA